MPREPTKASGVKKVVSATGHSMFSCLVSFFHKNPEKSDMRQVRSGFHQVRSGLQQAGYGLARNFNVQRIILEMCRMHNLWMRLRP